MRAGAPSPTEASTVSTKRCRREVGISILASSRYRRRLAELFVRAAQGHIVLGIAVVRELGPRLKLQTRFRRVGTGPPASQASGTPVSLTPIGKLTAIRAGAEALLVEELVDHRARTLGGHVPGYYQATAHSSAVILATDTQRLQR